MFFAYIFVHSDRHYYFFGHFENVSVYNRKKPDAQWYVSSQRTVIRFVTLYSDAFRHSELRQFERVQPVLLPKLALSNFSFSLMQSRAFDVKSNCVKPATGAKLASSWLTWNKTNVASSWLTWNKTKVVCSWLTWNKTKVVSSLLTWNKTKSHLV